MTVIRGALKSLPSAVGALRPGGKSNHLYPRASKTTGAVIDFLRVTRHPPSNLTAESQAIEPGG